MENLLPEDIYKRSFEVFCTEGREKDVAASHACVGFLRSVQNKKISVAKARAMLADEAQVSAYIEKTRDQIRKISPEILANIMVKIQEDMTSVLDATRHLEHISTNIETTSDTMGAVFHKVVQTEKNTSTRSSIMIGAASSLIASCIYAGLFGLFVHEPGSKNHSESTNNVRDDFRNFRRDYTARDHTFYVPRECMMPDTCFSPLYFPGKQINLSQGNCDSAYKTPPGPSLPMRGQSTPVPPPP